MRAQLLTTLFCCLLLASSTMGCGGPGGSSPRDDDGGRLCSTLDVKYTSYYGAGGPGCGDYAACYAGDSCVSAEDNECAVVLSAKQSNVSCKLQRETYDAVYDLGDVGCSPEDPFEHAHCANGDRCVAPAVCAPVKSADVELVHDSLIGLRYDPAYDYQGPSCGEQVRCFPGDRCDKRGRGGCSIVLSARGGKLNTAKLGKLYDATNKLGGPSCGGDDNCDDGDLCDNETTHRCRVVLSARSTD